MRRLKNNLYKFALLCLWACCFSILPMFPMSGEHPVLVISSYNPDSRQTSDNISDFMDEFERLGGNNTLALENMNCKSFSEAPLWKQRMTQIISKYHGDDEPSVIVLIGQEAWVSYLSLEDSLQCDVPVLTALCSRNVIDLPGDSVDLKTWMPESVDFFDRYPHLPVKAGFVYEYDVVSNVELIKSLYPQTEHIAFISDNSYGGVTMQAYVIEEMKKFPDMDLILLDGRVNTVYTIIEKLHALPPNTVVLVGTWRVDMDEVYFMRNATYAMMEAVPNLPVFSLSSVGIGYWAIGGVVPTYRPMGKDLAKQAYRLLKNKVSDRSNINVVPTRYLLDKKLVDEKELDVAEVKAPIEYINVTPSFYDQYRLQIWGIVTLFLILLVCLVISLSFYYHTKLLKDNLEVSEAALREAKDKAEEASRLKSAFLANMSHEIRTPLNAIVGFSDVLSDGECSEEEQRSYFEIIKTNSDLLLRLINDILDVSRLEANRMIFDFHPFDAVQVCQQVLASVVQARRSNNEFSFESEHQSLIMKMDIQRLQQVIINLLSNADKFTENGTIVLKLMVERDMAVISVTDTGCGIPLNKQKLVFDRFEKLNEYKQGTGLGLSICKLTVEKWGGQIWIDPDYTDGARFVFTHPLNL